MLSDRGLNIAGKYYDTETLLTWSEAHEHRQDPGENGRRIENFIGENEHLSQIIGDPFIVKI